jgi:hypothetical protein
VLYVSTARDGKLPDTSSIVFQLPVRYGYNMSTNNSAHSQLKAGEPATMNHEEMRDEEKVAAERESDVFWDEPASQDPANPMNWSVTRKWTIIAMVSFITFLT